jgi:uncharacterized membrane protein YphA (DoxX/SURF4 family)
MRLRIMDKSIKIHMILYIIFRVVLGVIFIAAAIPKILDTASFALVLFNYQMVPDIFINISAMILPWLEVFLGVFLILGIWMPGTVILYNLLMMIFITALTINVFRGLDVNCGCFSTDSGESINMGTILRDIVFLAMSLYLLFAVLIKKLHELKFSKYL